MGSRNISGAMEQSQYPVAHSGLTGAPPPPTPSQQQTPTGGYSHSGECGPTTTSSSSTQHLTSASLASLARLSQLSGPEGPFCSPPQANTVATCPPPPPAFSRMSSAPDILGPGGLTINPVGGPNSLYPIGSTSTNSSTASSGSTYQCMSVPQRGQQVRFHFEAARNNPNLTS